MISIIEIFGQILYYYSSFKEIFMLKKEQEITKELNLIFNFIKTELSEEYPKNILTPEYFILSVLENKDCVAFKILNKIMLNESKNVMISWYQKYLRDNSDSIIDQPSLDNVFDKYMDTAAKLSKECECDNISSGHLLCAIFKEENDISNSFKLVSVNYDQIHKHLLNYYYNLRPHKVSTSKKTKTDKSSNKTNGTVTVSITRNDNNVEKNLLNLNNLAAINKIDEFIGGDKLYQRLFQVFSKRNHNNIVISGNPGIGKTTFVRNIANLIVRQTTPLSFRDKTLVEIDFNKLIVNTGIRGVLENKINCILNDASKNGNYIFFVDNLSAAVNNITKSESDMMSFIEKILEDKNINFICTENNKTIEGIMHEFPFLKQWLTEITLDEPTEEEIYTIIHSVKQKLERYHNVTYGDDAIKTAINLANTYISEKPAILAITDLMDETGAINNIAERTNSEIQEQEKKLKELITLKNEYENSAASDISYYDKIDEFVKKEIKLKNSIATLKKNLNLTTKSYEITEDDIRNTISVLTGVPLEKITETERQRLKTLDSILKKDIVGQDEAVNAVCKTIRRNRVGLGKKGKPTVFMFLGGTGTGKTYLSKKIAEKVFGDMKYLVRLDMSEYSDLTSTNKLIGSSAGYVGYNDGGVLTNALKRNKYCVLLLDEIEKAHSEVYNMFLQLFDEGRLTDNKGNKVDCQNLIIIMTSNVGAKESSLSGTQIGFVKHNSRKKDIINKALKNKFSPEFINRIDDVIYFNELTEDNYRNIIRLELSKVREKILSIGQYADDTFCNDNMIDFIYSTIKEEVQYGARPILRSIEHNVIDKITEILLEIDEKTKHTFTFSDFTQG